MQSEIEAGRIPGHLDELPFKNFQINSMGLVKKKEKNKFRMIYDLSHPKKDSINSNIADIFSEVSYSSLEDALQLIAMCGPSVYLAKADIKSAFRLIPVRPDQHNLFYLQWEGNFYYDKMMAMGCRSSCQLFELSTLWYTLQHM